MNALRVEIRSYRTVFRLERRIFRIDRYRLPFPMGLEVRALVYAGAVWLALLLAWRVPGLGAALNLLPAPLHWVLLPGLVVFGLVKLRIDGRAPHRVLVSLARWVTRPRVLAGLRPTFNAETEVVPLVEVSFVPDWRGGGYRRGTVRGPATVVLRYPAQARETYARGGGLRRLDVVATPGVRASARGTRLDVPAGTEVRFP